MGTSWVTYMGENKELYKRFMKKEHWIHADQGWGKKAVNKGL